MSRGASYMTDKQEGSIPKLKGALSRRGFLKVSGAGAIGTSLVPPLMGTLAQQTEMAGPGIVTIRLNINGMERSLKVEPRVTLLDALRNRLDLTGAKKVCDRASCGACTVIVDGQAVYACSVLAIELQGSRIETVESLDREGRLHPVQEAFVENDAQQCGFCTPGFVVASKALLDRNPSPTREEVLHGLSGNICRCGTYVGVARAVLDAAKVGGTNG